MCGRGSSITAKDSLNVFPAVLRQQCMHAFCLHLSVQFPPIGHQWSSVPHPTSPLRPQPSWLAPAPPARSTVAAQTAITSHHNTSNQPLTQLLTHRQCQAGSNPDSQSRLVPDCVHTIFVSAMHNVLYVTVTFKMASEGVACVAVFDCT